MYGPTNVKFTFFIENTTLQFSKSATCFVYCFVAIIRHIPRKEKEKKKKKKEITQLQYWSPANTATHHFLHFTLHCITLHYITAH